jgi:hypothetical protein
MPSLRLVARVGSSGRLKVREEKAKELCTRQQEGGCMNLLARFPPHLSTHTMFEKTSCTTLSVCTPCTIYPDTNKGARGPPISQHGLTNR